MPNFEHTVEIAAPVDQVFAFDTDPRNWPRTMASLQEFEIIEKTGDSTRLNATYRILGRSLDGEMMWMIIEPDEHIVVMFDSPGMTGEVHNRYVETEFGTRMVHQADYEFGDSLLGRALKPVATRYNKRQFKQHLQNTKDLIEAETRAETDQAVIPV